MPDEMTHKLNMTAAQVSDYCYENDTRLAFGLSEDEIVRHNSTSLGMDAETTRKAIDELVRVGLLKIIVYQGARMVYRGDKWYQRILILEEQGWR
jgi:hypothetical protein